MSVSAEVIQILLDRIETLAVENAQLKESNEAYEEVIANHDHEKAKVSATLALVERDLEDSRRRVDSVLTISENLRAAIGRPLVEVQWNGTDNLPAERRATFPKITLIKFLREYNITPSGCRMGLKEAKDLTEIGGKLLLPDNMMGAYYELVQYNGK